MLFRVRSSSDRDAKLLILPLASSCSLMLCTRPLSTTASISLLSAEAKSPDGASHTRRSFSFHTVSSSFARSEQTRRRVFLVALKLRREFRSVRSRSFRSHTFSRPISLSPFATPIFSIPIAFGAPAERASETVIFIPSFAAAAPEPIPPALERLTSTQTSNLSFEKKCLFPFSTLVSKAMFLPPTISVHSTQSISSAWSARRFCIAVSSSFTQSAKVCSSSHTPAIT